MIKKEGNKYIVTDSSGSKTLGTHTTRIKALAQLKAIEANKRSYEDGGIKPKAPLSGEEFEALKEQFGQQEKTSLAKPGTMIDADRAEKLKDLVKQAKEQDPKLALLMKDKFAAAAGITPNTGRDIDFSDYYARIRGANPNLGEPILVPGQKEVINDIQKVKQISNKPEMSGKVFGDISSTEPKQVIHGVTDHIPSDKVMLKSEAKFAQEMADRAIAREAKTAALQAMKKGGKKLLSALPIIGGLASAAMSGDASAALPIPESEALGYKDQSPEAQLEKGLISPDEYRRLTGR